MGANPVSSRAGAAVAVQPAARRIGTTDATFVAGFKAWLALGYCAKKGERAIAIIAPLPIKDRDRISGEETGETRLLFKTLFVFDRSQVAPLPNGTPTPLQAPCEPLTGDTHTHLIAPLVAFAESLGYTVSFEPIAGTAGGWCDAQAKQIVVDADAPGNGRLRTLVPWRRRCIRTFGMPGERAVSSWLSLIHLAGLRRGRGIATVVAEPRA